MLKKKIVHLLFRNVCFVTCYRYYRSFVYKKQSFETSPDIFDKIFHENRWNSDESKSGGGSTISATVTLRDFLPAFFKEYNIHTVLDIPCGDYNWMQVVDKKNIKYIGADIAKEMIENNNNLYASNHAFFEVLDLTKDKLPKVDLIFCKDCLQHLFYESVWKALENIKRSGSTYLLTTSYPLTLRNHDILNGDYRSLNLRKYPFLFPKPLIKIREMSKDNGNELDKTMYLWRIESIPNAIISK